MNKLLNKIVWPVIAIPAVYLALVWNRLPGRIALHFKLNGEADRFGNKNELLLTVGLIAGLNILVYLLITNIYRIDPKKYAAANKGRLQRIAFATVIFLTAILCLVIHSAATGTLYFKTGLIFAASGLFFAIVGNYMPNMKPNYFAGFRLPWTLENADNWKKTHTLAGRIWFAGGLLLAVTCIFLSATAAFIVFIAVMLILVLIPCIYSYRLYQQNKNPNHTT